MGKKDHVKRIKNAAKAIEKACGTAEIAVVLGSGLGDYVEALEDAKYIDYKDIPNFPRIDGAGA